MWDVESGECLAIYQDQTVSVISISEITYDGRFVCGTNTGEVFFFKLHNLPKNPVISTAERLWLLGEGSWFGQWDDDITALCRCCGQRFPVPPKILDVIKTITCCSRRFPVPSKVLDVIKTISRVAKLASVEQSPCLGLPVEAWNEPRLLSECPHCGKTLKFNPFIVDNREDDQKISSKRRIKREPEHSCFTRYQKDLLSFPSDIVMRVLDDSVFTQLVNDNDLRFDCLKRLYGGESNLGVDMRVDILQSKLTHGDKVYWNLLWALVHASLRHVGIISVREFINRLNKLRDLSRTVYRERYYKLLSDYVRKIFNTGSFEKSYESKKSLLDFEGFYIERSKYRLSEDLSEDDRREIILGTLVKLSALHDGREVMATYYEGKYSTYDKEDCSFLIDKEYSDKCKLQRVKIEKKTCKLLISDPETIDINLLDSLRCDQELILDGKKIIARPYKTFFETKYPSGFVGIRKSKSDQINNEISRSLDEACIFDSHKFFFGFPEIDMDYYTVLLHTHTTDTYC